MLLNLSLKEVKQKMNTSKHKKSFLKSRLCQALLSTRLEAHVEPFDGVCQGADRYEIDSAFGIIAQRVECNAAR